MCAWYVRGSTMFGLIHWPWELSGSLSPWVGAGGSGSIIRRKLGNSPTPITLLFNVASAFNGRLFWDVMSPADAAVLY